MLKPASIADIKAELQTLSADELLAMCLRLARFKQDNKELLSYLLFSAHDTDAFIAAARAAISSGFTEVNTTSIFYAKKTLRKLLRQVNKMARYAADKEVEVALHLHWTDCLRQLPNHLTNTAIVEKMLASQLQKTSKLIKGLHEDLQYDYKRQLQAIRG